MSETALEKIAKCPLNSEETARSDTLEKWLSLALSPLPDSTSLDAAKERFGSLIRQLVLSIIQSKQQSAGASLLLSSPNRSLYYDEADLHEEHGASHEQQRSSPLASSRTTTNGGHHHSASVVPTVTVSTGTLAHPSEPWHVMIEQPRVAAPPDTTNAKMHPSTAEDAQCVRRLLVDRPLVDDSPSEWWRTASSSPSSVFRSLQNPNNNNNDSSTPSRQKDEQRSLRELARSLWTALRKMTDGIASCQWVVCSIPLALVDQEEEQEGGEPDEKVAEYHSKHGTRVGYKLVLQRTLPSLNRSSLLSHDETSDVVPAKGCTASHTPTEGSSSPSSHHVLCVFVTRTTVPATPLELCQGCPRVTRALPVLRPQQRRMVASGQVSQDAVIGWLLQCRNDEDCWLTFLEGVSLVRSDVQQRTQRQIVLRDANLVEVPIASLSASSPHFIVKGNDWKMQPFVGEIPFFCQSDTIPPSANSPSSSPAALSTTLLMTQRVEIFLVPTSKRNHRLGGVEAGGSVSPYASLRPRKGISNHPCASLPLPSASHLLVHLTRNFLRGEHDATTSPSSDSSSKQILLRPLILRFALLLWRTRDRNRLTASRRLAGAGTQLLYPRDIERIERVDALTASERGWEDDGHGIDDDLAECRARQRRVAEDGDWNECQEHCVVLSMVVFALQQLGFRESRDDHSSVVHAKVFGWLQQVARFYGGTPAHSTLSSSDNSSSSSSSSPQFGWGEDTVVVRLRSGGCHPLENDGAPSVPGGGAGPPLAAPAPRFIVRTRDTSSSVDSGTGTVVVVACSRWDCSAVLRLHCWWQLLAVDVSWSGIECGALMETLMRAAGHVRARWQLCMSCHREAAIVLDPQRRCGRCQRALERNEATRTRMLQSAVAVSEQRSCSLTAKCLRLLLKPKQY